MKVSVDLEILEKYIPVAELGAILDNVKITRENHKKYMKKWRENHNIACENHNIICENHNQTCENGEKMQFLGENHAQRGEGGFSFLNSTNSLNGTSTQEVLKEKNKIKKEKVCENHSEEISKNFEIFWQAYPRSHRKTDKKTSLKRFVAAFKENKGLSFETVIKGLEWWKKSNSWQDQQYIPAPEVWLNKCRWLAADNAPESKPSESIRTMPIAPPLPAAAEKTLSNIELAALFKGAE